MLRYLGLVTATPILFIVATPEIPGKIAQDGDQQRDEEQREPFHPTAAFILFGCSGRTRRFDRCPVGCSSSGGRGGHRRRGIVLVDVHAGGLGDLARAQTIQIAGHLPGGLIAVCGVLGHRGQYHRIDIDPLGGGQRGIIDKLRRRGRFFLHMLVSHGKGGFAFEWGAAGEYLVHDAAQRIDIGTRIGVLAARLLRGKVLGGTDNGRSLGHRRGRIIQCTGDAKVHHLHLAGIGEHDIRRLDIAVNDSRLMGCLQGLRDRLEDLRRLLGRQRAIFANNIAQRGPVDLLHHDIRDGHAVHLGLAGVIDRDDIGMV